MRYQKVISQDNATEKITDGLLCRDLDRTTHHGRVYQFSVGPWRMAEYIWPNFSGRQYPTNRRWLEALPAEGRLWVPSLYMGIIPLLLALPAMRLRRGEPSGRWLTWSALLAILASFGWYGLGWLVDEFQIVTGNVTSTGQTIGQPVGGLYWLMTVLLPGYIYFRYPAKLLVVAAIALSALAARGWDNIFTPKPLTTGATGCLSASAEAQQLKNTGWQAASATRCCFACLCIVSLLAAIATLVIQPYWYSWLSNTRPNSLFGPLDVRGAAYDLRFAFLQTAAVCGVAWYLLRCVKNRWAPVLVLVLVALDLAVANAWMVASAPEEIWQEPSKIAKAIRDDRDERNETGPIRVWRHPNWLPTQWQTTSSPDRLAESVRWNRDTLWPKHNLAEKIVIVNVRGTMMRHDYLTKLDEAGWPGVMEVTGAEYAILPEHKTLPGGRRITCDVPGVSLWHKKLKLQPCGGKPRR